MHNRFQARRVLASAAIAVVAAVGGVAGTSLAQGDGSSPAASTATPTQQASGILAGVHGALVRLVADGTITQAGADAVQQEADAGSIDPKQLVQSGAISDAQMRTVAAAVDQLKRAGG